jgi:hypothetical protein
MENAKCKVLNEVAARAFQLSILHSAFSIKMAARVGLAPTPRGLTNRRATLTPPGSWHLAPTAESSFCNLQYAFRI